MTDCVGIIYLVQPGELVGSKNYKIGCSNSPSLNRFKGAYKENTRYLYIGEVPNPMILEKIIKDKFNILFKRVAGYEFFECDEPLARTTFSRTVEEYLNTFSSPVIHTDTFTLVDFTGTKTLDCIIKIVKEKFDKNGIEFNQDEFVILAKQKFAQGRSKDNTSWLKKYAIFCNEYYEQKTRLSLKSEIKSTLPTI